MVSTGLFPLGAGCNWLTINYWSFNMDSIKLLKKLNTCSEGIEFVSKHDSLESAWNACERGDWMLWLAAKVKVPIKTLTLAKGLCVNTVRHLMKDERSIAAVDAAIAFGRGKITEEELETTRKVAVAADHLYFADRLAAADAAAVAAYAAAYAADAAAYADYAADAAADAADAAAYADYAADARTKNLKETADICRKVLTRSVLARIK